MRKYEYYYFSGHNFGIPDGSMEISLNDSCGTSNSGLLNDNGPQSTVQGKFSHIKFINADVNFDFYNVVGESLSTIQ